MLPSKGDPFDALGDPNRRAIVEQLREGDRSVQELADALPISRPAVSRHLRLLKEAGLVADRAEGTRRLYRLHDEGIEAVRAYLEGVWGEAAGALPARGGEHQRATDGAAARARVHRRLPARARVRGLDRAHDAVVAQEPLGVGRPGLAVTIEPRPGGRIFERTPAGEEHDWGEVVEWDPPHRLAYRWHLRQDRDDATRVEISFAPAEDGTAVTIVHSDWQRLGPGQRASATSAAGPGCCRTSCRGRRCTDGPPPRSADLRPARPVDSRQRARDCIAPMEKPKTTAPPRHRRYPRGTPKPAASAEGRDPAEMAARDLGPPRVPARLSPGGGRARRIP